MARSIPPRKREKHRSLAEQQDGHYTDCLPLLGNVEKNSSCSAPVVLGPFPVLVAVSEPIAHFRSSERS